MKVFWYVLMVVCGVIGALALLRFCEVLVLGGPVSFLQPLIAIVFLVIAWQSLLKARA